MQQSSDVVIAGGGVIGLSLAYELALRKVKVSVLERGQIGRESSWAGAGILAPQAEMERGGELAQLMLASRKLYPEFVRELSSRAGVPIDFKTCGLIQVALTEQEEQALQHRQAFQVELGLSFEHLSASEAFRLEDAFSPDIRCALYFPNEAYVDNRQFVEALRIACVNLGVQLVCGCQVHSVRSQSGSAAGFETNLGFWSAKRVIIAAGSWSGQVATPLRGTWPVKPARGQIVAVKCPAPVVKHIIYSGDCYLVPRSDGRILMGSTVEWVGYDTRVTLEGIQRITSAALAVAPVLKDATFLTAWSGLRPFSEDALPILGVTQEPGLYVATGHFRNGLLLSPITAKLMAELVVTGEAAELLQAFSPLRFSDAASP